MEVPYFRRFLQSPIPEKPGAAAVGARAGFAGHLHGGRLRPGRIEAAASGRRAACRGRGRTVSQWRVSSNQSVISGSVGQ
jgi:hypothetical protein